MNEKIILKHGYWKEVEYYDGWNIYYSCSVCGDQWSLENGNPTENGMRYCPFCGAKLDLERNENK